MTEKKKTSYDQKYLDEKFSVLAFELKGLSKTIDTQIAEQRITSNRIFDEINSLKTAGVVVDMDIKAIREQMEKTEQQMNRTNRLVAEAKETADKNSPYSVKNITVIVAVFAVMMFAFLLNGTELLRQSL
jgi:hypothetical protein